MFSKVHLRASTYAFVYSVSSFPFPWVKILIPKYFSVKYTYILSLTALSFSGLKSFLMSLYFDIVCIFFPPRTCRVYRKYTFCHLKPFSSLFSTFSPLAHISWHLTHEKFFLELGALPKPGERQELAAADIPFMLPCPGSDGLSSTASQFLSPPLLALPGGMGCCLSPPKAALALDQASQGLDQLEVE